MPAKRHRFAARRKAAGFSQEQLAERLSIDRSTVARWESGETGPQPWIRPRLARVLQVSLDQLDHLLAGSHLTEAPERTNYALTHPGSADLVTVAAHVVSARVRRELHGAEAEAAILMGQLVWDASQRRDHASARLYLDQAIDAARQVRDPAAEGLALLRKAMIALYGERNPREGLALAERTAKTTSQVSDVLTGLAILHTAKAHAMLGELAPCEEALANADTRFGRVGELDAAIELYSVTQFGRMAGSCYLFLADTRRAQGLLEAAAVALTDHSKSQAIVLGNLALALIRQGDLDEAAGRLHEAIDVIELNRGGGGLNIVFSAGREMRPWRTVPVVQDVYDRLLSLMAG